MKWKQRNHVSDVPFSFLLLLIFTLFTMMLAGTGAAVYKNSAAHLNENYTSRTAIAYISEKIRQHNATGSIYLSDIEGTDALVLKEEIEEEIYLTYIYYYDHALCELFIREHTEPKLLSGSRIIDLEELSFESAFPHMLCVTAVSPEGHALSAMIRTEP